MPAKFPFATVFTAVITIFILLSGAFSYAQEVSDVSFANACESPYRSTLDQVNLGFEASEGVMQKFTPNKIPYIEQKSNANTVNEFGVVAPAYCGMSQYFETELTFPVLYVDWENEPVKPLKSPYKVRSYEELKENLNGEGGVGDYLREISGGKLNINFEVIHLATANSKHIKDMQNYFSSNGSCRRDGGFPSVDLWVTDTIREWLSTRPDLSRYDVDNNKIIDSLAIVPSILVQKESDKVKTCRAAYALNTTIKFNGLLSETGGEDPLAFENDYQVLGLSVTKGTYTEGGPYNQTAFLPVFVHEIGHDLLGYADYYKNPSAVGKGQMWTFSGNSNTQPAAWERWFFAKWITPTDIFDSRRVSIRTILKPLGMKFSGNNLTKIPLDNTGNRFITVEYQQFSKLSAYGDSEGVPMNTSSYLDWYEGGSRMGGLYISEFDLTKNFGDGGAYRHSPNGAVSSSFSSFGVGDRFETCNDAPEGRYCVVIEPERFMSDWARVNIDIEKPTNVLPYLSLNDPKHSSLPSGEYLAAPGHDVVIQANIFDSDGKVKPSQVQLIKAPSWLKYDLKLGLMIGSVPNAAAGKVFHNIVLQVKDADLDEFTRSLPISITVLALPKLSTTVVAIAKDQLNIEVSGDSGYARGAYVRLRKQGEVSADIKSFGYFSGGQGSLLTQHSQSVAWSAQFNDLECATDYDLDTMPYGVVGEDLVASGRSLRSSRSYAPAPISTLAVRTASCR